MLLGAGLVLGAVTVVVLLPGFVALMERRFIRGEEARLAARFPDEWAAWSARVRRWLLNTHGAARQRCRVVQASLRS